MKGILLVAIILSVLACDRGRIDTSEFAKELEDRKIKHVSQGKIVSQAMTSGKVITDTLIKKIRESNLRSISCDIHKLPLTEVLERDFDCKIYLYNSDLQQNGLEIAEKEILDAYLYNIENKLAVEANTQNLKNGFWLYTLPVTYNVPSDTICIGQNGKPVKNGDIIGMWSIKLSEKALIRKVKL